MKIRFSQEDDAVYFRLTDSEIIDSEEIATDVVYDYDENDQVVGIEILRVKHKTPEELKNLKLPFSTEDKTQLFEFFGLLLHAL